jgi:hypothetical protein
LDFARAQGLGLERFAFLEWILPEFYRLLPNLEEFMIYHRNYNPMNPSDIRWRFRNFPPNVKVLGLVYSYEDHTPIEALDWFKKAKGQDHRPINYQPSAGDEPPVGFYLPQLKTLRIFGASPDFVMLMASRAPCVRTIHTDADVSKEDLILKLQDRDPKDIPAIIGPVPVRVPNPTPPAAPQPAKVAKPLAKKRWSIQALFSGKPIHAPS